MRIPSLLILTLLLAACGTVSERNFYEGLQMDRNIRQNQPGGNVASEPPPARSYEDYEKERQRLQKDARP